MGYRDYAKCRGYRLLTTPEAVMAELREIAMHYTAIEEKNIESFPCAPAGQIAAISLAEMLSSKKEWFALSILGINLPKNFINAVMARAFKDDLFLSLDEHLQLASLALTLLVWVEMDEKDIILSRHQKELLIVLIDTLIHKAKVDERLLQGPINLAGYDDPNFSKKFINAIAVKVAGLNIKFN